MLFFVPHTHPILGTTQGGLNNMVGVVGVVTAWGAISVPFSDFTRIWFSKVIYLAPTSWKVVKIKSCKEATFQFWPVLRGQLLCNMRPLKNRISGKSFEIVIVLRKIFCDHSYPHLSVCLSVCLQKQIYIHDIFIHVYKLK